MPRRYDTQKDPDELWTVYDKFTGWPAELDGLVLTGLSERVAKKFVGTLSLRDHIDRMAKGYSVKNARWLTSRRAFGWAAILLRK
ncbi:hypothetical protein ACG873_21005 [Mesorhizobium sp. AaZ16]|uniref:hypothetical protein n=1 Tax=Mesorhizobium sp. AaZ16 TaxID=3402289 RepID=UPI00374F709D